jgi:hypothetical protein
MCTQTVFGKTMFLLTQKKFPVRVLGKFIIFLFFVFRTNFFMFIGFMSGFHILKTLGFVVCGFVLYGHLC